LGFFSLSYLFAPWTASGKRTRAWRRFSNVSGTDGDSCFCGCGKVGIWTTSGFVASHANKISSDGSVDDNGDRKCVAPTAHLGVYYIFIYYIYYVICICIYYLYINLYDIIYIYKYYVYIYYIHIHPYLIYMHV
jgi:hypothetical protein